MTNMILSHNPVFSPKQFDRLSNIFDGAGQVIFGIAVLSPIFVDIDELNVLVIVLGLILSMFCWIISVWLAQRGDKNGI